MTETIERACVTCAKTEAEAHLEVCTVCHRYFCAECAVRAGFGRKFCTMDCARAYYFTGESDDEEETEPDE